MCSGGSRLWVGRGQIWWQFIASICVFADPVSVGPPSKCPMPGISLFLSVPHSAIWLVYGHNTDSISWPWLLLWSSSDPDQAQSDNNNNNFGYRHVASCPFCSSFFASKLCHHHHIAVPFRPGLLPSAKHTHITTQLGHISSPSKAKFVLGEYFQNFLFLCFTFFRYLLLRVVVA